MGETQRGRERGVVGEGKIGIERQRERETGVRER